MSASRSTDEDLPLFDEDRHERGLVQAMLAMPPSARLRTLKNFYPLYLAGQRRLGRAVYRRG